MSSVELSNTSNALANHSEQDLKKEITQWIHHPDTYVDQAQSFFVQSINRCTEETINDIDSHIDVSQKSKSRAVITKRNCDVDSLRLNPSLIAKSLGCGTVGGLAAAQLATQITTAMVVASCTTPAGWIGATGIAVFYYSFDKYDQTDKISSKAFLDIEKTERVAEKMLSSLNQRRLNLKLDRANTENLRLSRINDNVKAKNADLIAKNNGLNVLVTTIQDNFTKATDLIATLQGAQRTANDQLTAAQTRISTLDGNVATLQQENQTNLASTAARIDGLQRQNAQNLAEVKDQSAVNLAFIQKMSRDLIAEMRAEFEGRERSAAAKQIVERSIEKALRQEQEEKMSQLSLDLAQKSASLAVTQLERDNMLDQINHRFDIMTQAMSRNPTESSVSELLRSDDPRDLSGSDSENNSDFIEVEQEM